MKIAHFSDLHICELYRKDNIQFTRDTIEYALKEDCDHFVITGDLSHQGLRRDYEILRGIFDDYGLLDPNKLSLTIGNHDIFGGIQLAKDIIRFPKRCRVVNYRQKIDNFIDFFRESFADTRSLYANRVFPFAKVVQDVVFFGINSTAEYSMLTNPAASNGTVSRTKRKWLSELFTLEDFQGKLKIVLIHHHFNKNSRVKLNGKKPWWTRIEGQTMRLYRKRTLMKLFSRHDVALVLHGHVHTYHQYEKHGIIFLNGAGCFTNKRQHRLEMNMIRTSGQDFEIERHRFFSHHAMPQRH